MSKVFIDTNILVYSFDNFEKKKKRLAMNLLKKMVNSGVKGIISTQVLQEFYISCVKKLKIEPLTVKGYMNLMKDFEAIQVSLPLIEEAIDCSIISKVSFWDALIIVTAESAKCNKIWTEDLTHGQVIRGITIENPFLKSPL